MNPVHFSWPGDTSSAHCKDHPPRGEDARVSKLHQDQVKKNRDHEIRSIVQILPATESGPRVKCLRVEFRRWKLIVLIPQESSLLEQRPELRW